MRFIIKTAYLRTFFRVAVGSFSGYGGYRPWRE
jgi:hypothetical protein